MTARRSVRTAGKAKPKAKGASRAGEPRKAAAKPKPEAKAEGKAKPGARSTRGAGTATPRLREQPIRDRGGWREETLARMRALILEADPAMKEERKWKKPSNGMAGVPVWSHDGIVCTGETYAKVVKLTFAYGASVSDPARLFNASLEGSTRRAIDIHEGETVDAGAFRALVKAAVVRNRESAKQR